jgi:hypothetical protein
VCQGRTGILVAGRSLLMVIVAQSVGDARCQLDCLVPGASAGLLLIDCALLFAACLSLPLQYSNQQSPDSKSPNMHGHYCTRGAGGAKATRPTTAPLTSPLNRPATSARSEAAEDALAVSSCHPSQMLEASATAVVTLSSPE